MIIVDFYDKNNILTIMRVMLWCSHSHLSILFAPEHLSGSISNTRHTHVYVLSRESTVAPLDLPVLLLLLLLGA